jgi:tryptophan synthase alpha chain
MQRNGRQMIAEQFANKTKPLFIPFIMTGDPTMEATVDIAFALQEEGADIIELGIPYSDPVADGPVIQRASARALRNKVTIESAVNLVSHMRERGLEVPVILFTYYNPVLQYGPQKLFAAMAEAGVDGILIPDLPVEESKEIKDLSQRHEKPLISLIAPTSEKRIERIAAQADGFLYCVSSLGVTGVRSHFSEGIFDFLNKAKKFAKAPLAVGFGISTPEQITELSPYCEGIIVGSAIIKQIEEVESFLLDEQKRSLGVEKIKRFVQNLQSGVR